MGADSFKGLTFGFILFTVFAFVSLSFVDRMGNLNDVDTSQVLSGSLDANIFNNTLQNSSEEGEPLRQRFEEGDIVDIDTVTGVKNIFEDIGDFIATPWRLMSQIMTNILHIPVIVTHMLLTLVVLTFIFSLWRLFRTGD